MKRTIRNVWEGEVAGWNALMHVLGDYPVLLPVAIMLLLIWLP